jgi:hypothetical protein
MPYSGFVWTEDFERVVVNPARISKSRSSGGSGRLGSHPGWPIYNCRIPEVPQLKIIYAVELRVISPRNQQLQRRKL